MRSDTPRATTVAVLVLLVALGPFVPGVQAEGTTDCSFPVTSTDATGASVAIDAEPTEVVTLAPSAAQTLWEIGAKDKVIGVSTNADYLSGTSSLTEISTYPGVDAETVVNLDPDLVLAPNTISDEDVERLRSLGLTVYKFEAANTIEDVYAKTTLTGRLVGACDGAEATVTDMKEKIQTVREAVEGKQRVRVFYHMGGGWTAGSDTFIHEIVTTAGGENVAATAGVSFYQVLSPEVLVSENPKWFVRGSVPVPDSSPYSDTTAGRRDQVVVVDTDYMNQPAPRIVYPIETIAEALHPDVEIDLSGDGGVEADLTGTGPTNEPSVTTSGALSVAVSGLYSSRSVSIELPADDGPNSGGSADVRSVDLELRNPNPSFVLTVENATVEGAEGESGRAFAPLQRVAIGANGLLPSEVERATLRFDVQKATLASRGVDADALTLYRLDEGGWTALETTAVPNPNGTVVVAANASTIGTFALGAPTSEASTSADAAVDAGGESSTSSPAGSGVATTSPTPTARQPGSSTPTTTTPTPTGTKTPGQPGFGFLVGGLAVLAGAALIARGRSP